MGQEQSSQPALTQNSHKELYFVAAMSSNHSRKQEEARAAEKYKWKRRTLGIPDTAGLTPRNTSEHETYSGKEVTIY